MDNKSKVTQLRYISSTDPDKIIEYTNKIIPYKIEIKGNPILQKNKWFLWFVLPEGLSHETMFGDLD